MHTPRRNRLGLPAMLVAILALVLSFGGGAIAAKTLLIDGHDLKPNSVGPNKLERRFRIELRSTIKAVKKLSKQAPLPIEHAPPGPAGAKGETGSPGSEGKEGPAGKQGSTGEPGRDAITTVSAFSPTWEPRNGTDGGANGPAPVPTFTPKGLQFGPFVDGQQYAGVRYYGITGLKLKEVAAVNYVASYEQEGTDNKGAAPYLRFFIESSTGETNDVILSPNTQANNGTNELFSGAVQAWEVRKGSIRYNDDAGEHPDQTWNEVLASHGEEVIKFISIQAGDGGGYTEKSTAWLKSLFVEAGDKPIAWYEFRN